MKFGFSFKEAQHGIRTIEAVRADIILLTVAMRSVNRTDQGKLEIRNKQTTFWNIVSDIDIVFIVNSEQGFFHIIITINHNTPNYQGR